MKEVDADEHAGNSFQDENLPTTAGTLIEETWLNAVQDELVGCVLDADALQQSGGANLQLRDYLRDICSVVEPFIGTAHYASFAVSANAFLPVATSGLSATVKGGVAVIRGRLVTNTDAYMQAKESPASATHVYTASRDTYVQVDTEGNEGLTYVDVANGAARPTPGAGKSNVAVVVTDGSGITSITSLLSANPVISGKRRILTFGDLVNNEDGIIGPYTVYGSSTSSSSVDLSLGYTVPLSKIVEVNYRILSVMRLNSNQSSLLVGRRVFRRAAGSASAVAVHGSETLTENLTTPHDSATVTLSSNDVVFRLDAGTADTFWHKMAITIDELTHEE